MWIGNFAISTYISKVCSEKKQFWLQTKHWATDEAWQSGQAFPYPSALCRLGELYTLNNLRGGASDKKFV